MDRSASIPIRAGTTARTASAMQEQTGRAAGSVAETPPQGLTQGGLQSGPFARIGKDVVDDIGLARRDTTDSCLSDFSHRRSNTGWSIAASTATDLTDLNSPDVAFPEDGLESDLENYASSPRRGSLFPRPMPFHKRLPFRAPSISCDADRSRMPPYGSSPDSLAPRHRRLEQMAPRKPSLNRYQGPTSPSAGPGSPGRREPSPSGSLEPRIWEIAGRSPRDPVEQAGGNGDSDEPDCGMVGGSREPELQPPKDEPEEPPMRGDGMDVDANSDDDAPTPGQNFPEESLTDAEEGLEGGETFDGRRGSSSDEGPGSWDEDEDEGPAAFTPDDSIIYDVCEQVLQQAFGVQLHEVALAGAMPAAYESVSYFLDELSHIILNSGLTHSGIVIHESARGGLGSNDVLTWGAAVGGAAGSVGAGSGRGGGSGRKRSSRGHDGADSGDGAGGGSPGGGKRQKVSPTESQSTKMHFACPFRKRNPLRFNVRDFKGCATQGYPDISQVKRHLKIFHKQETMLPFTCQRCRRVMGSQEALDQHVRVGRDQICSPRKVASSADPEDGITSGIEEVLNGRKAGRKIDSWESLWRLLFPDDDRIPEADFIPPTELEEVWAEFNTDSCMRQLRERVQLGLGSGSNVESLLAVFRSHIESVFAACRMKTSSTAAGGRRLDIQTPQQVKSRRSSVRFISGRPTSRGRGSVDSGVSSPVATPSSTAVLGGLDQSSMVEAQAHTPSAAPPLGVYTGAPRAGAVGGLMVPLVSASSPTGRQGDQPVTVPPPAHVHVGFGSQAPNPADTLVGQAGHHSQRLLSMVPGMGTTAGFPDQEAADFSTVPLFGSHGYLGLDFGQPMHDLCLQPPLRGVHGVQGPQELFSPTDPRTIPAINLLAMDGELEGVRQNSAWGSGYIDGL